jgi:glycosyltransferase involved in cell wall biosynthesis
MINVAYLALAPFVSGSERCLQLMLENAESANIAPILITLNESPLKEWASSRGFKHYSVNLRCISKKNLLSWLGTQFRMLYILKKNKINVIHSNQIWSFKVVDSVAKFLNIRRVCHFRDPIDEGSKWWLPNTFEVAIFVSNHIEKEFKTHFSSNHVNTMRTLIDPVKFNNKIENDQLAKAKEAARAILNISNDTFIFGYIGQIAPVKGILELLSILSKIKSKRWKLIIAGKDPSINQDYLVKCKALVETLDITNQVIFCGFLEDTTEFYLACDLVTMFSHKEPLGLIPLEAAVNYTPTIANAVGGLPETIINNKTGWLVDISKPEIVVKIIEHCMQADLRAIGINAREFVEAKCRPISYMQILSAVYKEGN